MLLCKYWVFTIHITHSGMHAPISCSLDASMVNHIAVVLSSDWDHYFVYTVILQSVDYPNYIYINFASTWCSRQVWRWRNLYNVQKWVYWADWLHPEGSLAAAQIARNGNSYRLHFGCCSCYIIYSVLCLLLSVSCTCVIAGWLISCGWYSLSITSCHCTIDKHNG